MVREAWSSRLIEGLRRRVGGVLAVAAILCLFTAVANAAAGAAVEGRRAALVIGNSTYATLPKLPNAANDAERISEVLRDANFEVTVGENLDKAGLEATVRAFLRTLNDGDVALFYYSGHAVQVAGENYIIPVDAALTSSYDLEVESYAVSSLLDYMRAASGLQILVLDACRDNPFRSDQYFVGDRKVRVEGSKGLASVVPRQGSLIVYSTAPDQVAYDGAGDISPFAGAFSDHVLQPNREVRDVLTKIRSDVIARTGGLQVPWDVSSLTSQFYFVSAQNLLALSRSVTEIRVAPETRRVELRVEPPIASAGLALTAQFDKAPEAGLLLLDDKVLKAGAPFDAARLGDVVYVTEPSVRTVELLPYTVRSDRGQSASGAVAVVFDPALSRKPADAPAVASADTAGPGIAIGAAPVQLAMNSDVGTGFTPLPEAATSAVRTAGWLRVGEQGADAQLAVGQKMLVVGDVVNAADVPRIRVRPALQSAGREAKIVLTPVAAAPQARPVVIAVAAGTNQCDRLAAEPLDVQAVTEGVYPNDIRVADALAACRQAVAEFPDVARFRFQLGRVLYASGAFGAAVDALQQAVAGGHVRAGQLLGKLYQTGAGVPRDPARAIALFEAAARRGDPYAQHSLGKALVEGNGVKADVKRGIQLLTRAAESGHTYALNQLGSEYDSGRRVAKDVERARVMFEKSAARGDIWGEVNLGLMYRDGVAVAKDPARAYDLFEKANAKLHPYAGTLLAMMQRDRGETDKAKLLALYRQSAGRGDGWGAFYAAELIGGNAGLAADPSEPVRLYALAAGARSGNATTRSLEKLKGMSKEAVAAEAKRALIRLGAVGVKPDGAVGQQDRDKAAKILGVKAPADPVDLLVALIRQEWIASMPRLDML